MAPDSLASLRMFANQHFGKLVVGLQVQPEACPYLRHDYLELKSGFCSDGFLAVDDLVDSIQRSPHAPRQFFLGNAARLYLFQKEFTRENSYIRVSLSLSRHDSPPRPQ